MNLFSQIAHLLSTDSTFRQAFLENPEKAVAAHGLPLDARSGAVLAGAQNLLVLPPRELAERVSRLTYIGANWGGFTLDDAAPTPQWS